MLIHSSKPPGDQPFQHRHAAHCESGVMSSLLRHYGLDISEPMAFGLSSTIFFAHFPFFKVEGFPLTAYRAVPGMIISGLQKTLGVRMKTERFRDPEAGTERLNQHIANKHVVGVQASVFWLPYFPPDMRFQFNAHNLVVFGKQGNDYLISDPVAEHTVTCAVQDLQKARFVKGVFAPKGKIYYPTYIPDSVDLRQAVKKALRRTTFQMLKIPLPFIGVKGIYTLAKNIGKLQQEKIDPRYARLYVGFVVRMQEEIGTGGGGFRFVYASFLQEAAQMLNHDQLHEATELMTAAGDAWREFALLGARFCKKKSTVEVQALVDAVTECARKEQQAFEFLGRVKV